MDVVEIYLYDLMTTLVEQRRVPVRFDGMQIAYRSSNSSDDLKPSLS